MKNDFKGITRAVIYAIVMSFIIPLIFIGFNWLFLEGLKLFFQLKEKMFWLIFWILFFLVGLSIVYYVRYLATFVATIIVNVFSQICPIWYHRFSVRWVIFMCVVTIFLILLGYWWDNSVHGFRYWLLGLILLWINWSFARDLVKTLRKFNDIRLDELFDNSRYY